VRWEALFADLDAQWDAIEAAELAAEIADRGRREVGYLRLIDRLRPSVGHRLRVEIAGLGPVERGSVGGRLVGLGVDWLLVQDDASVETLVPLWSVLTIRGLTGQSAHPGHEGRVGARMDLRYALRRVARDRSECRIVLTDGRAVNGTVDRVGADFVDIAEHGPGEYRRPRDVEACTLPLAAIAFLRRL
jgi:hypothetical protein